MHDLLTTAESVPGADEPGALDLDTWVRPMAERGISPEKADQVARLLGRHPTSAIGELRIAFGHNCPILQQGAVDRADDAAIARAFSIMCPPGATRDVASPPVIGPPVRDEHPSFRERAVADRKKLKERLEDERRAHMLATFPEPIDLVALATDTSEPLWLVENFLLEGTQAHLSAPAKTGKSLLGLWIAFCLAIGRDPFTWRERAPIRVCYRNVSIAVCRFVGLGFGVIGRGVRWG
jgi:hypothetical protein